MKTPLLRPSEVLDQTIQRVEAIEMELYGDGLKSGFCETIGSLRPVEDIIGEGTYGKIIGYSGCTDYVIKQTIGQCYGWIRMTKDRSYVVIDNDQIHENIMSKLVGQFYSRGESICFFTFPDFVVCYEDGETQAGVDDDIVMMSLVPRFLGDAGKIKTRPFPEYNLDFIFACVLHSTILLQRRYACVHRDLKPPNVLVEDINVAKWVDEQGNQVNVKDYDTIVLDFGNNRKLYFETSKLSVIPKIADWGFACIYLETPGDCIKSGNNGLLSKSSTGRQYGIPDAYTESYDIQFFIAYALSSFSKFTWEIAPLFDVCTKYIFDIDEISPSNMKRFFYDGVYKMYSDYERATVKTSENVIDWYFSNNKHNTYKGVPLKSRSELTIAHMVDKEHNVQDRHKTSEDIILKNMIGNAVYSCSLEQISEKLIYIIDDPVDAPYDELLYDASINIYRVEYDVQPKDKNKYVDLVNEYVLKTYGQYSPDSSKSEL
jgi:serine/threonine protein kinase